MTSWNLLELSLRHINSDNAWFVMLGIPETDFPSSVCLCRFPSPKGFPLFVFFRVVALYERREREREQEGLARRERERACRLQ